MTSSLRRLSPRPVALAGAAACAAFASPALHAQVVAAAPSTVVITGTRAPSPLDRLAADVVILDRDVIEASPADSVADLLRRELGAQLSRSGGPGQNAGLLIRGAAAVNTVVFVDGVRVGSASLALPSLEALGLERIERIEVLRGPGSSLYGADAVGGVIQVFTKRGQAGTQFDAKLAVGGYASAEASAGVRGAQGAWDYAVSAGRERSRGVSALRPNDQFGLYNLDDDGFRLDTAQLQLGFKPAPGHRVGLSLSGSRLNAQYDGAEYPPPTFAPDATPDFRNRLATQVTALDWRGRYSPSLAATVRVSRSTDDLHSGGTLIDHFRTVRDQASAQLEWAAGAAGTLVGVVEHLDEQVDSTSFTQRYTRRSNALVLSLTGSAAGFGWQADVRHDDSSDYGGVDTARLGGTVQLTPLLRLRALAGTTFRAPSFNDLYFPFYGVATLRPERGRSVELGLVFKAGGHEAAATVYRNQVRDLIGYESDRTLCPPAPDYDFGCARNTSRARLQGATLSASHRTGPWALRAQVDFVDAKDEATGARLARRAAHQETLGVDWAEGPWTAGASLLRLGSRPDGGATLPAETTLDLVAAWRFAPGWRLQAKLLNATDRDLQPARDYRGLGRQAWLVMRYEAAL